MKIDAQRADDLRRQGWTYGKIATLFGATSSGVAHAIAAHRDNVTSQRSPLSFAVRGPAHEAHEIDAYPPAFDLANIAQIETAWERPQELELFEIGDFLREWGVQ